MRILYPLREKVSGGGHHRGPGGEEMGARPGRVSVLRSLCPELPEEMYIHGGLIGKFDVMPSRGKRDGLERQGKEDA